jgi:hypothetical protein
MLRKRPTWCSCRGASEAAEFLRLGAVIKSAHPSDDGKSYGPAPVDGDACLDVLICSITVFQNDRSLGEIRFWT